MDITDLTVAAIRGMVWTSILTKLDPRLFPRAGGHLLAVERRVLLSLERLRAWYAQSEHTVLKSARMVSAL